MIDTPEFDLVVIGGGINGCGIALDLQGRGLKTALIEKGDIASATSSASSKLIHGGLRYLEHREFRMVRDALIEREVLLKKAPNFVKPLRFIMPHREHFRASWFIRLGLWLYDVLGKRDILPASKLVRFDPAVSALNEAITKGYEYSDCWVDDARLVALNAVQYRERGGQLHNYTECISASQEAGQWHIHVRDTFTKQRYTIKAKGLVNATGPWAESFITHKMSRPSPHVLTLIKGSHIIVPKLYAGDKAFILQNKDGRIVFVIPYLGQFSLIGTTDEKHQGAPGKTVISSEEKDYLCSVVNENFKQQISAADIVWHYSGTRALCDDEPDSPQALTRDYTLSLEHIGGAPLLSVFGGKLTTYRKLSEQAANRLQPYFPEMTAPWTATSLLPGGDIGMPVDDFVASLQQRYAFLTANTLRRLAVSYGTCCYEFLTDATCLADLGIDFGSEFTEAELRYLMAQEFVKMPEDALWRRTKMGLFLNDKQQEQLADFMSSLRQNRDQHYA